MADRAMTEHTWRTPTYACLNCGYEVDSATASPLDTEPRPPQEGDVTICFKCSYVMVFTPDKRVREPTGEELAEIARHDEMMVLLHTLAAFRRASH